MRVLRIAIAALVLSGCSIGKDLPVAEAEAVRFHQLLDSGKLDETWKNTTPQFRSATPQAQWLGLVGAVHKKLGKLRSAKTVGWNDNFNTNDHVIVLNQEAQYEHGTAQEQFAYSIADGKAVLQEYHVNSNALIAN
ncbi:DUF4019 domain-containing protein [Sphingomonas sp. KR3-1]|uniref:DUF4019 domain-containing protein n=1 Tax=Sphingomonas sp. KR3-1 TaxID=3156611 RepID=UPI0032B3E5FB